MFVLLNWATDHGASKAISGNSKIIIITFQNLPVQNRKVWRHNKFRKVHEVPPMTLDTQMCEEAEEYAKHLARRGIFEHSDTNHGENLAFFCSSYGKPLTMEEAVTNW